MGSASHTCAYPFPRFSPAIYYCLHRFCNCELQGWPFLSTTISRPFVSMTCCSMSCKGAWWQMCPAISKQLREATGLALHAAFTRVAATSHSTHVTAIAVACMH